MRCSASGKGDARLSFPCKAARCWKHHIFPRATGPCLTAVWTLKRGDNLISTHVNTAAGAKRKLWAYCVSVISSCILWPQEWKIFKWLWCPGSCWTALMVWKHLSFFAAHLPWVLVNGQKLFVGGNALLVCCVLNFQDDFQTANNNATYPSWSKHKCRAYTGTTLSLRALTAASICQSPCGYCCSTGRQTARACGLTDPLCQQVIISN